MRPYSGIANGYMFIFSSATRRSFAVIPNKYIVKVSDEADVNQVAKKVARLTGEA